ncbi:MAG: aminopeptidase [Nitrospinota bacterium]|jgi:aminopeptidase|nr:aminopeptidase [Nitrospinota bacterium]MDP7505608.1 aminopeptidase [Nitrospinota bacterium]
MDDVRIERMAETIARYSAKIGRGELVCIRGGVAAAPLIRALYTTCLKLGAYPYTQVGLSGLDELFFRHASKEQLSFVSPISKFEVGRVDVLISVLSETNTRRLSSVNPKKQAAATIARQSIMKTFMKRAAEYEKTGGKKGLRWTLTLFPTEAYAQDAEMSLREYEDFVFAACFADKVEGIRRWKNIDKRQREVIRYLKGRKVVEIGGKDTDLRVGIAGRPWINCAGTHNFPDGEIFTGPEEAKIDGTIRYTFPACLSGREVEDVRLTFEKGRVVKASAEKNEKFLKSMIGMDEGASRVGEFAFGLNQGIQRFTKNILFDEKIGGTLHLALGKGYPESGSKNNSALHWDMVCDMRRGGEILVDGRLFSKNGKIKI